MFVGSDCGVLEWLRLARFVSLANVLGPSILESPIFPEFLLENQEENPILEESPKKRPSKPQETQ